MKEGMSGKVGVSGFLLCMSMVFAPFTGCANGSNNKKKWGLGSKTIREREKGKKSFAGYFINSELETIFES